jgi:hypothetical protein
MEEDVAARDPITSLFPKQNAEIADLASVAAQSQGALIEMLRDRFDRLVDEFVRYKAGVNGDRAAVLDTLFELHEKGLLTKAEVRTRGDLDPEEFYSELQAYRLRSSPS